ncbi:unnamed protein product [Owenia fusiformis]|uniref:RRM domain-containing protein n=1 Tax=Owenia fusiformis TaxID=6347 RepID=A0A8S4PWG3_OWEFU|nr:unnamed protein product [Owenia fusiformis]
MLQMQSIAIICLGVAVVCLCTAQRGSPTDIDQLVVDILERALGEEIRIKNLVSDFNEDSLRSLLELYGTITSFKVYDDSGTQFKYAQVKFSNSQDAADAVADLNRAMFMGQPMVISVY